MMEDANPLSAPEPERATPTDARVSQRYGRLAREDTSPELALRRELFSRGLRYRVHYKVPGLPRRKVDIAFTKMKVAVQVDGCFWHGCPEHGVVPGRNSDWWKWKIERNKARDRDTDQKLSELGWAVVRVWEHTSPKVAAHSLLEVLNTRSARSRHTTAIPARHTTK